MKVDQFDFDLPEERIALRPVEPRESARLLHVTGGGLHDRHVADLPKVLRSGDVLVFNDTKVIPAQLEGIRRREAASGGDGTARVSATLHMRVAPDRWKAFMRPARRVAIGDRIRFGAGNNACELAGLDAEIVERGEAGEATLRFDLSGAALDAAIAGVGHIPLPPYIASKRPEDERDRRDYQTIYARHEGAVAAPTAGLHFTEALFTALAAQGIGRETLTLHVGAGTFLPVKAEDTKDHVMHSEIGIVGPETAGRLNAARREGRRIVAVGTTALRLLESAATPEGVLQPFDGATDIFITPGYRFRAVDALMTNFHLPRSTLFMLVSAFAGLDAMRAAYTHAIACGYRFYSYGDACFLERPTT